MKLYIDPGTGSMLFYVMIGLVSVLFFAARSIWVKIRHFTGKQVDKSKDVIPFVMFSEGKQYWHVFEPVIRELSQRSFDVVYMTAAPDDPGLDALIPHFRAEFVGEGNKAFAKLNFLKATMIMASTPSLDVYQWKRSRDVKWYIFLPHGANDSTMGNRFFGLDWFDAVIVSGDYQKRTLRELEFIRHEQPKDVVMAGVPYMDEMLKRREKLGRIPSHPRTVMLAPTWGANSIFHKYGKPFIDKLIETGYHIIIRPHPQSFVSEKEMMDDLMKTYPDSDQVEWNRDGDNFGVLARSDIMISEYSGIIFDFAFVFDRPVICADTEMVTDFLDIWWIQQSLWAVDAVPRIGPVLTKEKIPEIKSMIDAALDDASYIISRHEARDETWCHIGDGAKNVADYVIQKYHDLTSEKEAV